MAKIHMRIPLWDVEGAVTLCNDRRVGLDMTAERHKFLSLREFDACKKCAYIDEAMTRKLKEAVQEQSIASHEDDCATVESVPYGAEECTCELYEEPKGKVLYPNCDLPAGEPGEEHPPISLEEIDAAIEVLEVSKSRQEEIANAWTGYPAKDNRAINVRLGNFARRLLGK